MKKIAERTLLQHLSRAGRHAFFLLLWFLFLLLLLCQATIWYLPQSPLLAVLDEFAAQLSGLTVIAVLLALVLRRWVPAVLLMILAATLSWPMFASRGQSVVVANPIRLKVLSANLWQSAPSQDRTIQTLMASNADIIGLVEVTPDWRLLLTPVIIKYPYRADCVDVDRECQILLLSKLPIQRSFSGRVWQATPIVAGADLMWNGRPITVIATHLYRPLTGSEESEWGEDDPAYSAYLADRLPLSRQAGQAGLLAKYLNSLPGDLIVMGDFNSAPWSRVQRAFRDKTGLGNRAGWDLTWPSWLYWPLRLPLDHVLARGRLTVTKFAAGPETDSDHLPVVAEVGWRD